MPRICHLFDDSTGWEQRVGVGQLLDRLPSDRYAQSLIAVDPQARRALHTLGHPITLCARRMGLSVSASPALRRLFERLGPDIIHAWGVAAAVAARAATDRPIVVPLFDPRVATQQIKRLRTLARSGPLAVACSCEIVRRRLIEGGLEPDRTVVIRPGVDFGLIHATGRRGLRAALGIAEDERVVILPPPLSRDAGHFDAAWAVTLLRRVEGGYRLILPNPSTERRRITRFIGAAPTPSPLVHTDDGHPLEQLIAISDVMIVPASGDVSTTAIAWAMASNTAVIGGAVHAVAELLAHKVNGLLFKPARGRGMTVPIARLLRDHEWLSKARETVRGQAYEVFGLRRYIDDHRRLCDNLLGGTAPAEGIADSSHVA